MHLGRWFQKLPVGTRSHHNICLHGARQRAVRLALPVDAATPMFVPVVTAKGEPDAAGGIANRGSIVIEIGGAL